MRTPQCYMLTFGFLSAHGSYHFCYVMENTGPVKNLKEESEFSGPSSYI